MKTKTKVSISIAVMIIIVASIVLFTTKQEVPGALPILEDKPFIYISSGEITKETAIGFLLVAESDIAELKTRNLTTFYVQDLLYQAQRSYIGHLSQQLLQDEKQMQGDEKEYINKLYAISQRIPPYEVEQQNLSRVEEYTQQIAHTKEKIYDVSDSISVLEREILNLKSKKANVVQAEATLERAKEEFSKERYDDSIALLRETVTRLQESKSELTRVKALLVLSRSFVERNWIAILIIIGLILVLVNPAVNAVQRVIAKRKVIELKEELKTVQSLIVRAQEDCFKYKKITPDTYKILEGRYRAKIASIREEIPINQAVAQGKIERKDKNKDKKELIEKLKKSQLKI